MKKYFILIALIGCTNRNNDTIIGNKVNLCKIDIEYTDSLPEFNGKEYVFQHYKHLFYTIDSRLIDSNVSNYLDSFVFSNTYINENRKKNQRFEVYILFSNDCFRNPNLSESKLIDDCSFDEYKARKYFWGNYGNYFKVENFNSLNPDFIK